MDTEPAEKVYDWIVAFRNPKEIWEDHSSYLALEILTYVCFTLSLKHALGRGGKHFYLFVAVLLHGLVMEYLSISLQQANNFWRAQSSVMLLGGRLPLHTICHYPVFAYTAIASVSSAKLPSCAQLFLCGAAAAALGFPEAFLGSKLLWWSLHDTDPALADRLHHAPWNSLCYPAVLVSSLSLALWLLRKLFEAQADAGSLPHCRHLVCSLLAALLAVPLEILQYNTLYHVPHDLFLLPTKICVCVYLAVFVLLGWMGDRCAGAAQRQSKGNVRSKPYELLLLVVLYLSFFVPTAILSKPENIFSVGLHQPIGNCSETETIYSSVGMTLSRNKYLCASDYDEGYFDFHCAMQPTTKWENRNEYIICGTPFTNHNEYIVITTSAVFSGIYFYYQLLMKSGKIDSTKLKSNPKIKIN